MSVFLENIYKDAFKKDKRMVPLLGLLIYFYFFQETFKYPKNKSKQNYLRSNN